MTSNFSYHPHQDEPDIRTAMDKFREYLRSIFVWGLPGFYVIIFLYIAIILISGIRIY